MPQLETSRPRILLIEDDPTISDLLAYNLRRAGYEVFQEQNGRAGLQTAISQSIDLVLMDLMLPGLDGMTASREILRRKPSLPLIMLTAKSERDTMLEGFSLGADDYITKPFDLDILLARVAARLRHKGTPPKEAARVVADGPVIREGSLVLDRDAHVVHGPFGDVHLNPKEYDLLELLASWPGHLFPREEIVERVWHQRYLASSRTLDVHVRRLRAKLERVGVTVGLDTVRGVGYRLVPEPEDAAEIEDGIN